MIAASGWFGMAAVLLAYSSFALGRIGPRTFHLGNLAGVLALTFFAIATRSWPFVGLNGALIIFALVALWRLSPAR